MNVKLHHNPFFPDMVQERLVAEQVLRECSEKPIRKITHTRDIAPERVANEIKRKLTKREQEVHDLVAWLKGQGVALTSTEIESRLGKHQATCAHQLERASKLGLVDSRVSYEYIPGRGTGSRKRRYWFVL